MTLSTAQKSQKNVMDAFSKAGDLKKRILFTLVALVVFRFGTFIPLPGIDLATFEAFFARNNDGLMGMFNTFAGGALSRMSLLALNIMPYISASIIVQLGSAIFPALKALRKDEAGHRKMNQYTRYLTILIAIVQGYGMAVALENMDGGSIVTMSSVALFRLTTVVSLLGGTLFVVWLGDQITSRGVGNGSSLIITAGIIAEVPRAFVQTLTQAREGSMSSATLLIVCALIFALIYVVVFVERAQRRIVVQYPKGQMGTRSLSSKNSYFPLKINPTGVMPPIFASALLMLPLALMQFLADSSQSDMAKTIELWLTRGGIGYMVTYALLIIFFTFFYTGVVFNPKETAENLKKNGGFIAGIRPGASTAEYLDYVMTRLTTLGAFYLATLCVLPEILISELAIPFVLGGTTLLIVVTVMMDTMTQIQSHLLAYQYESLIRKAHLKGRL